MNIKFFQEDKQVASSMGESQGCRSISFTFENNSLKAFGVSSRISSVAYSTKCLIMYLVPMRRTDESSSRRRISFVKNCVRPQSALWNVYMRRNKSYAYRPPCNPFSMGSTSFARSYNVTIGTPSTSGSLLIMGCGGLNISANTEEGRTNTLWCTRN